MNETDKNVMNFLNKCGIIFENYDHLNGMLIPREVFVSDDKYEEIKNDIKEIKKIFSSSSLTSLQINAKKNQKWPLLNLVRQILKQKNIIMEPKRESCGYDQNGKKKYKRYFKLKKIKEIKKCDNLYKSVF
jgi:hypothetical protein